MSGTEELPSSILSGATTEPAPPDPALAAPPENPDAMPDAPPVPAEAPAGPDPFSLSDLTIPEGLTLEEGAPEVVQFLELTKGLGKEGAQTFLDLHANFLQRASESYLARWETTQTEWQEQVRALPEFGGDALPATLANIAKVLDRYGDAEVREAFAVTGAGNHPAMVRMMAKIARDLNEAPPVRGDNAPPSSSRASRMYATPPQ